MTFKLNMTDQEANAKDYELPPSGNYLVRITDLELGEVKSAGDNFGKPLWKMTLSIEEGPYKGLPIKTSIMLFDNALFMLKNLCESIHPEFIEGNAIKLPTVENGMPSPDPWLGQVVNIKGTKFAAGTQKRNSGYIREYDEFRITFKKTPDGKSGKASSGLPMPS